MGAATVVGTPYPVKEHDPWDTAADDPSPLPATHEAQGTPSAPVLSDSQLDDTIAPEEAKRAPDESRKKSTGEMRRESSSSSNDAPPTARATSTGGRQPTASKQLEPGTVLNGRYEIVRRIGGGGMGAVYLAKDRNLGDAPRAVKEMIESHIDSSQHDKAINDFKRESLLLTSLEHS